MKTYRSFQDIRRFIGEHMIDAEYYIEDYDEGVALEYCALLQSKGWSYGEELPEISFHEFWDCFKIAEA